MTGAAARTSGTTAAVARALAATGTPDAAHSQQDTGYHQQGDQYGGQVKICGDKIHHRADTLLSCFLSALSAAGRSLHSGAVILFQVMFGCGTQQHPQAKSQHSDGCCGEEAEADLTRDQAAQLIHHQGRTVSQQAHITNGQNRPAGAVHLPLDRTHSGKAGGAQQVEDHKAVGSQRSKVGGNVRPDLFAFLGYFSKAIQHLSLIHI